MILRAGQDHAQTICCRFDDAGHRDLLVRGSGPQHDDVHSVDRATVQEVCSALPLTETNQRAPLHRGLSPLR